MTAELSDSEKFNIIQQHIKTCVSNRYNLQISLIAEQAVSSPNEDVVNSLNEKIAREDARQSALEAEALKLDLGV